MQPFTSKYVNKLDAKGRVSVPAAYRQALAAQAIEGLYCAKSVGHRALTGFGRDMLERVADQLKGLMPGSREYLVLSTFAGQSTLLSFDDEGRVRIPDELIEHAGLKDRVLFNGAMDIFEIWEPETFKPVEAQRLAAMAKALGLDGGP